MLGLVVFNAFLTKELVLTLGGEGDMYPETSVIGNDLSKIQPDL